MSYSEQSEDSEPLGAGNYGRILPIEGLRGALVSCCKVKKSSSSSSGSLKSKNEYPSEVELVCVSADTGQLTLRNMDVDALISKFQGIAVFKEAIARSMDDAAITRARRRAALELTGNVAIVQGILNDTTPVGRRRKKAVLSSSKGSPSSSKGSPSSSKGAVLRMLQHNAPFLVDEESREILVGIRVQQPHPKAPSAGTKRRRVASTIAVDMTFCLMKRYANDVYKFYKRYALDITHILAIMKTALVMLHRLHSRQMYHMDIKQENMLYDIKCADGKASSSHARKNKEGKNKEGKNCKSVFALTDYNLMEMSPREMIHGQGTTGYISPLGYQLRSVEQQVEMETTYSLHAEHILPFRALMESYQAELEELDADSRDSKLVNAALAKNDLYAVGVMAAELRQQLKPHDATIIQYLARRLIIGRSSPDAFSTAKQAADRVQEIIDALPCREKE